VEWTAASDAPCRLPAPLTPAELAACFTARRIGLVEFSGTRASLLARPADPAAAALRPRKKGMSVIHSLKSAFVSYIQAAFPNYVSGDMYSKTINLTAAGYAGLNETVFVTNLRAPWLTYLGDSYTEAHLFDTLVAKKARWAGAVKKFWVSPGFAAWERRLNHHAARALGLQSVLREPFLNNVRCASPAVRAHRPPSPPRALSSWTSWRSARPLCLT
jgi:hypothetical protein